jgi:hypothetical protein
VARKPIYRLVASPVGKEVPDLAPALPAFLPHLCPQDLLLGLPLRAHLEELIPCPRPVPAPPTPSGGPIRSASPSGVEKCVAIAVASRREVRRHPPSAVSSRVVRRHRRRLPSRSTSPSSSATLCLASSSASPSPPSRVEKRISRAVVFNRVANRTPIPVESGRITSQSVEHLP